MTTDIEHKGTVFNISGKRIDVSMDVAEACGSCKVKEICGAGSSGQKLITVLSDESRAYTIGEVVAVTVTKGMGMKAVLLAYVIPFFILLFSLLILSYTGLSEVAVGTASLAATAVYYLILFFFRDKIEREIIFKIKKI